MRLRFPGQSNRITQARTMESLKLNKRRSHMRKLVLTVLLVVAFAIAAEAQETTATITGTATDQTGAVLPGVTVTARNIDTGASRTVTTNAEGVYIATLLSVGAYEVTFEIPGFQTHTVRGVELHVNDRQQID